LDLDYDRHPHPGRPEAAAAVAEDGIRQQPRDCSYRFISLN